MEAKLSGHVQNYKNSGHKFWNYKFEGSDF